MKRLSLPFANLLGLDRRSRASRAAREIALRPDDHWTLPRQAADSSIRCLRGTVWITSAGQAEDVVLTAGHEWHPGSGGQTLVGALSDALVSVGQT